MEDITPVLRHTIINLIEKHNVNTFYVGDKGDFDNIVRKTLREICAEYPQIEYAVIPAYMPGEGYGGDSSELLCPYVFEKTPPRFAILKRNNWMLSKADFVVTYVTHTIGGAARFKELAEKQGKTVINLHKI